MVSPSGEELLRRYERRAGTVIRDKLQDVLLEAKTGRRRELVSLRTRFRDLMAEVGNAGQLAPTQRARAEQILRRARRLVGKDWKNVRGQIRTRLRNDSELKQIAAEMTTAGDARLGNEGHLLVKTVWEENGQTVREGFEALEPDHFVRITDNPWLYSDPRNLNLTDSAQNQLVDEAIRRTGIWATDDIERFVVGHGLASQSTTHLPGH